MYCDKFGSELFCDKVYGCFCTLPQMSLLFRTCIVLVLLLLFSKTFKYCTLG